MWLYHHSRICQPSSFPRKPISSAKGLTWHISIYCIRPQNPEKIHFPPKRGGTTFGCWKQPDYIYIHTYIYTHIHIHTRFGIPDKNQTPLSFIFLLLLSRWQNWAILLKSTHRWRDRFYFWDNASNFGISIYCILIGILGFIPPQKIAYICIHLSRIKCGSKWLLFPYFAA